MPTFTFLGSNLIFETCYSVEIMRQKIKITTSRYAYTELSRPIFLIQLLLKKFSIVISIFSDTHLERPSIE